MAMQNEEYWKRKTRKQTVAIATSVVSVLVVIGWISFYQLPTAEDSGPSFLSTIQESIVNAEQALGPISIQKTLDEAGNALQDLSESAPSDANANINSDNSNVGIESPSENLLIPETNANNNSNTQTP